MLAISGDKWSDPKDPVERGPRDSIGYRRHVREGKKMREARLKPCAPRGAASGGGGARRGCGCPTTGFEQTSRKPAAMGCNTHLRGGSGERTEQERRKRKN